ncbi:MAG: hypothetical protein C5B50_14205 [Verrucomicrobia bacterium]|nr:MAG: hypothetical protein C5B50_14205 [Verrucomicrobiota bacterium]
MPTQTAGGQEPGQDGMSFANALRDCLACGISFLHGGKQTALLTREAAQILGLGPDQSLDAPLEALPKPLQEIARESISSGSLISERQIELGGHANGSVLRVSAIPLKQGDTGSSVVLVFNNLTLAQQLERRIQQLERLASAGTMAASMAHEIKNALVAGKTFVDLLLEKNKDSELVEIVRRELSRIDSIVSRMLKFAGPSRPSFERTELHEVLEHCLRLVQRQFEEKQVALNHTFSAEPDVVRADEYELQQAVVNLLLNALDATAAGGTVTVQTENVPARLKKDHTGLAVPPRTEIPIHRDRGGGEGRGEGERCCSPDVPPTNSQAVDSLRLTIADTGHGVLPEHMERLFEPFFTTKPGGTGLGLSITRRIIQEHGGSIHVESTPGKGTCFTILLPACKSVVSGQ